MNDNNNNFEQMKSAEDFLKVENLDKNETQNAGTCKGLPSPIWYGRNER